MSADRNPNFLSESLPHFTISRENVWIVRFAFGSRISQHPKKTVSK
jgi:hypothetical protein